MNMLTQRLRNAASRRDGRHLRHERGFVLVVAMLFLLVLLLLGASMFRSFTMQEVIAGNTREKSRSFEVAQSALRYGESWLANGSAKSPVTCAGALQALIVCGNLLDNPSGSTSAWAGYYSYYRPDMHVSTSGGMTSGDINYQAAPQLYINYLSPSVDGKGTLYQVTATGFGGNADTTSVVQSTYELMGTGGSLMEP